jgi:hypothetical protein
MRRKSFLAVIVAGAVVVHPGYGQDPAAPLPVRVANASKHARDGEPVSFGFPVPEAAGITDVAVLTLRDGAGATVPCQFKALARWRAPREALAPLKWVLATLRPGIAPATVARFEVLVGSPGPAPAPGLAVTVGGDVITVRTGPSVEFAVPTRAFGPFASVTVGTRVVTEAGRLEMADPGGAAIPGVVTAPTTVEESGPIRAVLVQRGSLGELRYTCRWWFHAGRSDVIVEFRLENPLAYGLFDAGIPDGQQYFDRLEIAQPIAGDGHAVTSHAGTHPVGTGQAFELRQGWRAGKPTDVLAGFWFTETSGARTVASGGRHFGALDVSGSAGGVTVLVERFAENHPKAIAVRGGALRIALFPEFGHGPEFRAQYATPASADKPVDPLALESYRFEGGRWKSHRMTFDFHPGSRTPAEVAGLAARVESPLVGYPDPALVRTSRALGILWAERGCVAGDPAVDRFERFLDVMADDSAADPSGGLGRIGLPGFLARGGTYGGRETFGWDNFGDIPWGNGWCNLHYDWPAAMLSGFLRTGDVRLFARGCDMARFRRDLGQNHGKDDREAWRGAAFYEKGWWHGNTMPGTVSHNWLLGVLLHYALTGDEGSREAAVENAAMAMRAGPGRWSGYWGSRIPGWAIDTLVDAWNFLGDAEMLDEASRGVARYEELELADGGGGYHLNPANGRTTVWMENILFIAAAKHALATSHGQALPLLGRMRNWFKRSCILPPQGDATAMTVASVLEDWSPAGGARPSVHHVWTMAAALSYSAVLFDDADDRLWATVLFESVARYWQETAAAKPRNFRNAATWSPITMRPLAFPNSESKVLANVLNFGAPYLGMRALAGGAR